MVAKKIEKPEGSFYFLEGLTQEGKSIPLLNFLLFKGVFKDIFKVEINLGFRKLFGITYMFWLSLVVLCIWI
jgi:hypothetical protein